VLLAAAVGADFEVDGLAAAGVVGAAAGAVAAAAGASDAGLPFVAFCTPPCPLQAPRPVAMEVVPSLQVLGVPDAAGSAGAAGAAAAGAAGAALVVAAFWTPPCPLHAPRPVAVEVVPSLQVVGALESAAYTGSPNMNVIKGTARNPTRFVFFMKVHSPALICVPASNCKRIRFKSISSLGLQCAAAMGSIVVTFITNGVCSRPDPA
jgi:hypothetical protein